MPERDHAPIRILVADDQKDSVETLAALLRHMGHHVATATSSVEALDAARRTKPELIFLDIAMPHLDGWQLAPLIRQELGAQAVHIVAVSGYADQAAHIRSRKAGMDAHVAKPIDMALLKSILAQLRNTES